MVYGSNALIVIVQKKTLSMMIMIRMSLILIITVGQVVLVVQEMNTTIGMKKSSPNFWFVIYLFFSYNYEKVKESTD